MGLLVHVLRPASGVDTTAGGLSASAERLCVVNIPGPFDPSDRLPAVILTAHLRFVPVLVPAVWGEGWRELDRPGFAGPMAGGNFATSSDGRWSEAIQALTGSRHYGAVPIHDRYESAALAAQLSR